MRDRDRAVLTWAKRTGHEVWGLHAERRFFGEKHWAEPLKKWNRWAGEARCRTCRGKGRVWFLFETPHLDWQLLTKIAFIRLDASSPKARRIIRLRLLGARP